MFVSNFVILIYHGLHLIWIIKELPGALDGTIVYKSIKLDEFESQMAETAINQATLEADEAGISGPATTPWLLGRVAELTAGDSLRANLSLLGNNGRVAGAVAVALNHQEKTINNDRLDHDRA